MIAANTEQHITAVIGRLKAEIADRNAFPSTRPTCLPVFIDVGIHGSKECPVTVLDIASRTGYTRVLVCLALNQLAMLLYYYETPIRLKRRRISDDKRLYCYWLDLPNS